MPVRGRFGMARPRYGGSVPGVVASGSRKPLGRAGRIDRVPAVRAGGGVCPARAGDGTGRIATRAAPGGGGRAFRRGIATRRLAAKGAGRRAAPRPASELARATPATPPPADRAAGATADAAVPTKRASAAETFWNQPLLKKSWDLATCRPATRPRSGPSSMS